MPTLTPIDKEITNKKLAKALVKHNGKQTNAWRELYPEASESSAKSSASRYLAKNPEAKEMAIAIANKSGFSLRYLINNMKRLSKAKKPFIHNNNKVYEDDNQVQLNATVNGLKLHKALQTEGTTDNSTNNVQINVTQEVSNKLLSRLDKVIGSLDSIRSEHMPVSDADVVDV